jgi:hypothetical protein
MTPRLIVLRCVAMLALMSSGRLIFGAPIPPIPPGLSGRYAVPDDQGFIDLRPDGSFSISHESESSSGTYTVLGTAVNLVLPGATMPPLHFANGVLTIGDGVKMARVGNAAPPPPPGTATKPAIASNDRVNMTRSIVNVRQLCVATLLWASRHQGSFPDTLEQLLTKEYAGADPQVSHCPLLHNETEAGYIYLGKGSKNPVPGGKVIFLSKWSDADGKHILGRADGSVVVEAPQASDLPATVGATPAPAKPTGAAVGNPDTTPAATGPGAAATPARSRVAMLNQRMVTPVRGVPDTPPESVHITLTATSDPPGAGFPVEQMPPNPLHYFWIIDRPDQRTAVMALRRNSWAVNEHEGVFHMHVEYRAGNVHQPVSNVVEFTVPAATTPAK